MHRCRGEPATLVRMIGLTVSSTSARLLLRSLCLQLCHIYGGDPTHLPYVSIVLCVPLRVSP